MNENAGKVNSWQDAISAGDHCLSWDALRDIMDGGSSNTRNVQHLSGCVHCQAELAMLKSFERALPAENDQTAVDWIVARLQRKQGIRTASVPFWRDWLSIPRIATAAALVTMAGLSFSLYISSRQERPLLHGSFSENLKMRSGDIRLAGPSGELDETPDTFRWEALPLAKSYSIQLLEVDGTILWSGMSAENSLIANPELKMKMHPGKMLLWKVTALDASGKPIAISSAERFRVIAAKRRINF
ncbi:MAG TPA: hypothetical protein VKT33_00430 [Candidatus Angelobacter sp.]|nr:hypothetical protein [Candidatus Angelobacter sp.]